MTGQQSNGILEYNPPDNEIKDILETNKTVAIVGLSNKPERDSYKVAEYLKGRGYKIIPVNPGLPEILGEKSYPDLVSIPDKVDVVDIFRNVEAIPGIVDEAVKIKAKVVWMQLGLSHNESAQKALDAGLKVVQARCMKIEHTRLLTK